MSERRQVHLRYHLEVIEALGWAGFKVIAEDAEWAAASARWSDAHTVSERLEWRHVSEEMRAMYGMIFATFEVVDA